MEKGNHSMERVRLPLEYTVRQSGTRGRLISLLLVGRSRHAFIAQSDGGEISSNALVRREMPQLTGEILHLLYHRRESRLRHYSRPSGTNGSTDKRLRLLLPRGMLFRRLQPHRLP